MAQAADEQDPFAGILDRSSIAQALREARASLARPSRPFTPASRSLFQQADDPNVSRPSSSYSIDQIKFVNDTFAATSESMISTRSTLRSRDSCSPIAEEGELEAPELTLSDLETEVPPVSAGQNTIQRSSSSSKLMGQASADEDEYDNGNAADDLALRMDVPPCHSDEDSEEELCLREGSPAVSSDADGGARPAPAMERKASGKLRLPPTPTQSDSNDMSRKKSEKKLEKAERKGSMRRSSSSSAGKEWSTGLKQALVELEQLEKSGLDDLEATQLAVPQLAERLRGLAMDLRGGRLGAQQEKQAPRVLRAVLSLMDRGVLGPVDSPCLLRLAHCSLDLLRAGTVLQDVGGQGVAAAYLNVARALFKLSKDSSLDAQFKEEGILEQLLNLLSSCELHCAATDLRIFVVGILKNLTNGEENQKYLARHGALPILQALMRSDGLLGSSKEVQLLIQITALLRNVAASSKRHTQFVEMGLLTDLTRVSTMYTSNEELQVNISRILGKLSVHDRPCEVLGQDPAHARQVVRCLQAHQGAAPLVLRLSFLLGNLAARSEDLRHMVMFDCDALSMLPGVLERYWRQDRKLAQAEAATQRVVSRLDATASRASDGPRTPRSQAALDCESVLVKLVRLVANATISERVGMRLAATATVVDPLLDILGCKRMPESEELVLSTTAALTNLLFYDAEENLLFSPENKQLLCRLLRPMLLESYNVEALVEAARALGNLSRHEDARQWIGELRIDEVLCILLAHDDRDLVFYSCGALVNLAADPAAGRRLCQAQGLRPKLAALLRDAPADDYELLLVAVKVLSNMRFVNDEGTEAPWSQEELRVVRAGLDRASKLPQPEETAGEASEVPSLAAKLLSTLQEDLA